MDEGVLVDIAVAFTAYQRPQYFQETLETWSHVKGVEDVKALVRLEPSQVQEAMKNLFFECPFDFRLVIENSKVAGPLRNPWLAFESALQEWSPDFVIVAEDDSVVSPDVLDYFRFAAENYQDKDILTVCAFQNDWLLGPDNRVVRKEWFAPTIWGTWASTWTWLRDHWDFDYSHRGWDNRIHELLKQEHLQSLFPVASRSNHIGRIGGAHMLEEYWESSQAHRFVTEPRPDKWSEVNIADIRSQG